MRTFTFVALNFRGTVGPSAFPAAYTANVPDDFRICWLTRKLAAMSTSTMRSTPWPSVAARILAAVSTQLPDLGGAFVAALAVISGGAGLLVERWLFFAEAVHAVSLYYGTDAA